MSDERHHSLTRNAWRNISHSNAGKITHCSSSVWLTGFDVAIAQRSHSLDNMPSTTNITPGFSARPSLTLHLAQIFTSDLFYILPLFTKPQKESDIFLWHNSVRLASYHRLILSVLVIILMFSYYSCSSPIPPVLVLFENSAPESNTTVINQLQSYLREGSCVCPNQHLHARHVAPRTHCQPTFVPQEALRRVLSSSPLFRSSSIGHDPFPHLLHNPNNIFP